MEKIRFAGLDINKISIVQLLLNKTMLLGYVLLVFACIGIYEIFDVRYFSAAANAHASGLNPTDPALKEAMRLAVFGDVGEVNRNIPWTLFIVNYMYMIYTGSGVIFLVALAELMNFNLIAKAAAGFMVIGISMVFAGLFTIATDLNMLNMVWMVLTPNLNAGMWLMLPLYCTYIPFVLFEIYLVLTHKREWAKRLALPILVLSIGVDLIEYYIQAKLFYEYGTSSLDRISLFDVLFFIISAFVSSLGIMGIISFFAHRSKTEYKGLMDIIRRAMLFFVSLLGLYEIFGYMTVDKDWAFLILFGPFRYVYFTGYIFLTLALPFLCIVKARQPIFTLVASISVVIGGFVGRYLFVYGGNANPMSNRFGLGYEKYDFYALSKSFNYVAPHLGEIFIVVGSVGVVIMIYKLFDTLFSVNELREHH
ncbi:Polysulfide reductase chain C [Sulfurospirillum diekertiae]|uniref:Polysulfide reductase chain C n=1 Tax=Sulfurospirillum diekertiae TaxID=1854492 RepID=A0A1Y0HS19_9BACT|nr:polysulfide reductase [Sulfurospirillum diekertiae]ARU50104.1 Polysulfide reductase chain C [Sulfurospirillum diekertiae]